MASFLTRIAERAIGTRPTAMPMVRPVFAAPAKLLEQEEERFPKAEAPRSASILERHDPPQAAKRSTGERTREARGERSGPERNGLQPEAIEASRPRIAPGPLGEKTEPSKKPTLQEVIQQIYRPRETVPAKRPSQPAPPISSVEGDQDKDASKTNSGAEPRIQRALPPEPELRPRTVFGNNHASPPTVAPLQPAKIRTDADAPVHEVHVSIGRIELKAAPQAAPPMPARTAPPRPAHLSLAEYLERRRGGRR